MTANSTSRNNKTKQSNTSSSLSKGDDKIAFKNEANKVTQKGQVINPYLPHGILADPLFNPITAIILSSLR
ncbi:MAG: hypothetical protein K0R49_80 [Burkholderiales bacterium]|jgi:hypothetical protein|nr:hypothetical protein [Burkholderiales bacterium]